MIITDLADYLSECCSWSVHYFETKGDEPYTICLGCGQTCTVKLKVLGINVKDEMGITDKGPGQT